jgi:cytochrome c oxidase cbb3-type subunit 3
LEQIKETITKGRVGQMPPMAAALGSAEDARNVAHYVMSLSGSPHNSLAAQAGKTKFAVCAGCHGADGRGNMALGAPNLRDKVWLHGWGEQAIVNIIQKGKLNVMPAQDKMLTPEQIHVLSGYVWSLSNRSSTLAAR